jgi:hypothetical protein
MTLRLTRLGPILAGWLVLLLLCAAARGDDPVPADPEPRWWKGNLHTPEMVAEWYRTNGWNFLALSDHNILSQGQKWMPAPEVEKRAGKIGIDAYIERFGPHWIERRYNSEKGVEEIRLKPLSEFRALVEERGRFIMIQSEEILELIKPQTGGSVVETIENNLRAVVEQSERTGQEMLPHINHPNFGWAITAEELAEVVSENFFEVYNGHPGVNQLGDEHRPSLDPMWDIANTLRLAKLNLPPLYGLGTDDSHHHHFEGMNRSIPGRGWVMVRARRLTPESLIRALRGGDFYASTGVTLSDVRYSAESGTIEIDIEPTDGATYVTEFIGTPRNYDDTSKPSGAVDADGNPIHASRIYSADVGKVFVTVEGTKARYELTGDELYVRARITSSEPADRPSFEGQRKQAWTQPVGWRVDPQ